MQCRLCLDSGDQSHERRELLHACRKGSRNVAVAPNAHKLLVQVWHLVHGNPPPALESNTSFRIKLQKLAVALGSTLRTGIGLGKPCSLAAKPIQNHQPVHAEPSNQPNRGYAPQNPAPLRFPQVRNDLVISAIYRRIVALPKRKLLRSHFCPCLTTCLKSVVQMLFLGLSVD